MSKAKLLLPKSDPRYQQIQEHIEQEKMLCVFCQDKHRAKKSAKKYYASFEGYLLALSRLDVIGFAAHEEQLRQAKKLIKQHLASFK